MKWQLCTQRPFLWLAQGAHSISIQAAQSPYCLSLCIQWMYSILTPQTQAWDTRLVNLFLISVLFSFSTFNTTHQLVFCLSFWACIHLEAVIWAHKFYNVSHCVCVCYFYWAEKCSCLAKTQQTNFKSTLWGNCCRESGRRPQMSCLRQRCKSI